MITFCLITGVVLITAILFRNKEKRLIHLSYYFGFINIVFSLIGIINYFVGPFVRNNALLGDRVFDTELLISLFGFSLFISLLFRSKNNLSRYFTLYLNVTTITYLLILRTRAGWVAAVIMLITSIIMVWIYHRKSISVNKIALKTGTLIITALIVYILIPVNSNPERPDIIKTAESIFDRNYYSNQSRIDFWGASLKMFTNNPIFGIGAGKWAGNYPPYSGGLYTDENVDMNFAINPHNDYLEILVEYGLSGFLLFSLFIFAGLYSLFKKSRNNINYLPYYISALGICILMFFSFTKDNFLVMIIFGICMGVGYSSNYQLAIMNYEFFKKNKVLLKKFILVIGILLLSMGIWFKVMSYLNEREYLDAMRLKAQGKYVEMLDKLNNVSGFYYPVDMNKMPVDYYRGVGYFELKQYDKALEKFRNAREYMKYYPTIMNNEASALYMTGKNNEAEKIYLDTKGMFPNYIEPQINLLSFYTNQKRIPEAKDILAELEKKTINTKYVKNYSVYLQIKDYFKETIR